MSQQSHRGAIQPGKGLQPAPTSRPAHVRSEPLPSWDIRRARHALRQVQQVTQPIDSEFVGTAKKLPMMIRTCGLAQAMAFYETKSGSHAQIVSACGLWLVESGNLQLSNASLAEALVGPNVSSQSLRRCTAEVMSYLFWFIRFLDARKR